MSYRESSFSHHHGPERQRDAQASQSTVSNRNVPRLQRYRWQQDVGVDLLSSAAANGDRDFICIDEEKQPEAYSIARDLGKDFPWNG
jgi:hypothetical protein